MTKSDPVNVDFDCGQREGQGEWLINAKGTAVDDNRLWRITSLQPVRNSQQKFEPGY
jgi:hypothetical protein